MGYDVKKVSGEQMKAAHVPKWATMMVRSTERDAFLTVDMPLFRKDLAEGREMNENARGKRTEDRNGRCRGRVGAPCRTPRTGQKNKHIILLNWSFMCGSERIHISVCKLDGCEGGKRGGQLGVAEEDWKGRDPAREGKRERWPGPVRRSTRFHCSRHMQILHAAI